MQCEEDVRHAKGMYSNDSNEIIFDAAQSGIEQRKRKIFKNAIGE